MRGVSTRFARIAAALTLLVVFAHAAVAADRYDRGGWRERYERAKRFAVTVLARLSIPPG
jgi:hypothetical protein